MKKRDTGRNVYLKKREAEIIEFCINFFLDDPEKLECFFLEEEEELETLFIKIHKVNLKLRAHKLFNKRINWVLNWENNNE